MDTVLAWACLIRWPKSGGGLRSRQQADTMWHVLLLACAMFGVFCTSEGPFFRNRIFFPGAFYSKGTPLPSPGPRRVVVVVGGATHWGCHAGPKSWIEKGWPGCRADLGILGVC